MVSHQRQPEMPDLRVVPVADLLLHEQPDVQPVVGPRQDRWPVNVNLRGPGLFLNRRPGIGVVRVWHPLQFTPSGLRHASAAASWKISQPIQGWPTPAMGEGVAPGAIYSLAGLAGNTVLGCNLLVTRGPGWPQPWWIVLHGVV